jgi:hypothetical protein
VNVGEVWPIVSGILMGTLLGYVRPGLRVRVATLFGLGFALAATLASGEYRVSWGYLLLDAALVAGPAAVSYAVVRKVRWVR